MLKITSKDPMIAAFGVIRQLQEVFALAAEDIEQTIGVPTCIPNCGICCQHNIPPAMTIEAINIVSHTMGNTTYNQVIDRCEDWLLQKHSFATIYKGKPHGLCSPELTQEWQAVNSSRCPLLTDDQKCLIHSSRPFVCRAYGITRDAADICPRPLGRGEGYNRRAVVPADGLRHMLRESRDHWKKENPAWIISGCVPTMIYRCAKPDKFNAMAEDNKIASAKLVGVEYETNLMWQPQMVSLRKGLSPDLVAAMR